MNPVTYSAILRPDNEHAQCDGAVGINGEPYFSLGSCDP